MNVTRTERGWHGHFICADSCQFSRNTLLHREDDNTRIVVSTIGAMLRPIPNGQYQTIGCDRTYETMAFHAKQEGIYWDIDSSHTVEFDAEWCVAPKGKKLIQPEDDMRANEMHEAVVSEIMQALVDGKAYDKSEEEE